MGACTNKTKLEINSDNKTEQNLLFYYKKWQLLFHSKKGENCKVTTWEVSSGLLSDHVFFYGSGTSSGFVPKSTYPKESPEILGFRPFYSKLGPT